MATSPTKPSTPRLSEAARCLVIPEGIVTTGWPQVVAKGRELRLLFDWWQDSLGRAVLGKRADGKYAATVGGVVLSIPRQVGKTYFVGSLLIIMCILFPGLQVVWTAHRTRTATRTFRSLQGMAKRKRVAPHIASIRVANGEQEIAFRNGSLIMFGAREQGFGRGFDTIDVEVFDEAQILTEKALEDMIAATNQAKHPHGALLFYMGTPPRPVDPGEAFTLKRKKARSGKSTDMLYLECSADADGDPDDPAQWRKANFSYPLRTPHESMRRLRENLNTEDGWLREGLGIWDADEQHKALLNGVNWKATEDEEETHAPARITAFAVETDLDRAWSSICAAGKRDDDRTHVEVVKRDRGTRWLVDEAKRLDRVHGPATWVIDGHGPAADLIPKLEDEGLRVLTGGIGDVAAAAAWLVDAINDLTIAHGPHPELDNTVGQVKRRTFRDGGFALARVKSDVDVTPWVGVSLAGWAASQPQQSSAYESRPLMTV